MYQPVLNRFLTRDPLPPNGQPDILYDNNWFGERMTWMRNTYGYASNNPVNRVDPSGLQDSLVSIFCPPLALLPIFEKPGTPECKNKNFKGNCWIIRVSLDPRGNCPADFQRVEDHMIVGGKHEFYTYCVKCIDPGTCKKGSCIPCVEEETAPKPHPFPPGKDKIIVDKGSKLHTCKCFVDEK